jgi:hypothetical protein
VRNIAGEPEQLELEREPERVEACAAAQALGNGVESREEALERLEPALVLLLLHEEAQHRLRAHEPHRAPVRILPRRPVRVDKGGAGDCLQVARALVQQ